MDIMRHLQLLVLHYRVEPDYAGFTTLSHLIGPRRPCSLLPRRARNQDVVDFFLMGYFFSSRNLDGHLLSLSNPGLVILGPSLQPYHRLRPERLRGPRLRRDH